MLALTKMNRAIKAVICAVIVGLAMPAIALADHDHGKRGRKDRDGGRFERDFDRGDNRRRNRDDDDDRRGRRIFKTKRAKHAWWENDFNRDRRDDRRGRNRIAFRLFR